MERTAATCVLHSFERYEKKYILTEAQYEAILPEIQKHTVMDVYGQYTICNIYYDTEHYDLIRQSLRKPYYKEKFRVRSYGVPGAGTNIFAEIKKKSGDIVYKRRVDGTPDEISAFLDESAPLSANRQIQDEILWFDCGYEPLELQREFELHALVRNSKYSFRANLLVKPDSVKTFSKLGVCTEDGCRVRFVVGDGTDNFYTESIPLLIKQNQ